MGTSSDSESETPDMKEVTGKPEEVVDTTTEEEDKTEENRTEEDKTEEDKTEEDKTEEVKEDTEEVKYPTQTLEKINTFDYVSTSITNLSDRQLSANSIKKQLLKYGSSIGTKGMPFEEYIEAMEAEWTDYTDYKHKVIPVEVNIEKSYTYPQLVSIMRQLSRYDGVHLYRIGKTTQGQNMYAIEVDVESDNEKQTVVLTGNIHARETAGGMYILKQLSELLKNSDNEEVKDILSKVRFVAVPVVNPDGRDGVAFNTKKFTYSNGLLWKDYANGTDGNRNFAGLHWGQVLKGNQQNQRNSFSSKSMYYAGEYAGSCSETKVMMKFLYHYIVVEQAKYYVDYHQQGRIMYAGKPWQTKAQEKRCTTLAKNILNVINSGNSEKYTYVPEKSFYGLSGEGSTLTDYAVSLAVGSKFSKAYGFNVFTDGEKEKPLIMVKDLDTTKVNVLPEANKKFATFTLEIGLGTNYLGYSSNTRKLLAREYERYNFDKVLLALGCLSIEK